MIWSPPKYFFLAVFLLCAELVGLYLLLSSPHYSRLALGSFRNAEPSEIYRVAKTRGGSEHTFAKAITLVESLTRPVSTHRNVFAYTDNPDSCIAKAHSGDALQCYNIDVALITLLQRAGFNARLWSLNGDDGLGGLGHNLVEVLDEADGRWKVIDPQFRNYYTLAQSPTPLSILALREFAISKPDQLSVTYIRSSAPFESARYLIGQIRELSRSVSVNEQNDFAKLHTARYGWLQIASPLFDKLSIQSQRGLRSFLLGGEDQKLLMMAEGAPDYHPLRYHFLFIFLLVLLPSTIALLLLMLFKQRPR